MAAAASILNPVNFILLSLILVKVRKKGQNLTPQTDAYRVAYPHCGRHLQSHTHCFGAIIAGSMFMLMSSVHFEVVHIGKDIGIYDLQQIEQGNGDH